jgi:hypothetical protein
MLVMLTLKGAIVTADALNCHRAIAQQIVDRGGDYALTLKGNHGTPHDDVIQFFDDPAIPAATPTPVVEADHGRIEIRPAAVSTEIARIRAQRKASAFATKSRQAAPQKS